MRERDFDREERRGRRPAPGGDRRYQPRGERPPVRRQPITAVAGGQLPKWVREEILRSTPKERRDPAIYLLGLGVAEFADGDFRAAARALREAKSLSSRAATIRELLGLAAYELSAWEEALRELRAFRRLTGDTTHMPVEMDCLRALRRQDDVTKTWHLLRELGADRATDREARVVYGSSLLDQGRLREAWEVVKPGRLIAAPLPADLRLWFVAARVALAGGDLTTTRTLCNAIRKADAALPGLEELAASLAERTN